MLFLPQIDLWIANEPALEQSFPKTNASETLLQPKLPSETPIEIVPYVLEGSVDNFDPVVRAKELERQISPQWCGEYISFNEENDLDILITFSEVKATGQLVNLRGEMQIGKNNVPVVGSLNAKSNQLELIPYLGNLLIDLEPGGSFLGLQGNKILGWNSPRLDHPGGRLEINNQCFKDKSKTPVIRSLW